MVSTAMIGIAWLAFACLIARGDARRYFGLSLPAVAWGAVAAARSDGSGLDAGLCFLGLVGAWLGIAGVQLVARRSVSLNILALIAAGADPEPPVRAMFHARCGDLTRVGLATLGAEGLALTPRGGRAAASFVAVYRLFDGRRR